MNSRIQELTPDKLRRKCNPNRFSFKSTAELPPLDVVVGQDRAVRAVSFGIDIESPGYHMYALGPPGTGKSTTIQNFLQQKSQDQPVPDDWCYVNNFVDSDKPHALQMPAGMGCKLKADMDRFVEDLRVEIPNAFESEQYEKEQKKINQEFQERRQQIFEELDARARKAGFRLLQTPRGIILAPIKDGEVLTTEQFNKLDTRRQAEIEQSQRDLQDRMRDTVRKVQGLQQEAKDELFKLDQQVVGFAVQHLIEQLEEKYRSNQNVVDFFEAVRQDILQNVDAFKQAGQQEGPQKQIPLMAGGESTVSRFEQYRVNLIVDHSQTEGAPVILESNPTYANLIGRVEHQAQFGALITNFQMIKAGALHRANGGYLMVNVNDILTNPYAWEGLKRVLQDGEIKIESLYQALGAISTRTLEPEPIPLDIKVILTGNPMLYYLLYSLDEDFRELFKVKADFAIQMDWGDGSLEQYAQFIGSICEGEHLTHFAPSGVAKIIEQSARMVSHQGKLSTKFGDIVDLIRQASYWAKVNGNVLAQDGDVDRAVKEQIYRANRLEEVIQEMIEEGTLLIDTQGEVAGQVNGISVLPLGDYAFGKPSRITARTYVGKGGVVNIDRESKLGGPIHNKGVLILTGYLGGKFAQDMPLAFSASVTFEQLYEEVEGDSASSAELYALLSSLSGYPIRQNLAVTGSVNQHGQVQAIGGVNEKIEGFYNVCKLKGLTGDQGVIIPGSNVSHLMLCQEVIEAVIDGKFHIYPVVTIDEGIEILTGVPAGVLTEEGTYPQDTIYHAIEARLKELAEKMRGYNKQEGTSV